MVCQEYGEEYWVQDAYNTDRYYRVSVNSVYVITRYSKQKHVTGGEGGMIAERKRTGNQYTKRREAREIRVVMSD